MERIFDAQNYFSMRHSLKSRQQELETKLRERLPGSELKNDLFEYLVVKREAAKELQAKEHSPALQGAIKELGDLVKLFEPTA